MKDRLDLVRGWLKKAESDLLALDGSLSVGAFDAACFHAQQAAEKYLKAFLIYVGREFPLTHNLSKLVELCAESDPAFQSLLPDVEPLTPYAVELRYDSEFWPSEETAQQARSATSTVRDVVLSRVQVETAEP